MEVDDGETLALGAASLEAQEQHAEALRALEAKRKARAIEVATDDAEVRAQLRALGQPVCLFGEREGERRDRLRELLARAQVDGEEWAYVRQRIAEASRQLKRQRRRAAGEDAEDSEDEEVIAARRERERKKTFYTPASDALVAARKAIATFSFERAKARLAAQNGWQRAANTLVEHQASVLHRQDATARLEIAASQIGDRRPISCCALGARDEIVATGSFSGAVKIWRRDNFEATFELAGHTDRLVRMAFSPVDGSVLASGSADATVRLWRVPDLGPAHPGSDGAGETEPRTLAASQTLSGHALRLGSLAWHPMGQHLGTASHDHTWRLWDAETGTELLLQEGHEHKVHALAFHPDGSLAVSGDLAGVVRVWDLRSGRAIASLMGHVKGVVCADASVDGHHVATGSLDHTARIWDLRKRNCVHVVAGHLSLVSRVRFDPLSGGHFFTSSYDRSCKVWSTRNMQLLRDLRGHEHLVMDIDVDPSGSCLVSASYDRTWKLWCAP